MRQLRAFAILPIAALILAACQGGGESPTAEESEAAASNGASGGAAGLTCDSADLDGQLADICEAGVIRVSTDPAYPPQSFLNEDTGEYEGFDIDVANEIGERLGVEVEFTDPTFDAVVAGSWADRWDMSVGSVTVTAEREEVLDFTQPYYFTPAQAAVLEDSDIQSLDDLAGQVACVGESTTYLFWIEGTLSLPESAGEITDPPEGLTATTFPTDIDCAEAWRSGRTEDFQAWVTALPTAQDAIDSGNYSIRLLGDPVFFEPLAVAFDKGVDDNDSLVEAVDAIVGQMHDDGTLSDLSDEWYEGIDYTVQE
jgi:polar amino acid transport system substrate-binding protein